MKRFEYSQADLRLVFEISDENRIRIVHFGSGELNENALQNAASRDSYQLYNLQLTGYVNDNNHGPVHIGGHPGLDMKYVSHRCTSVEGGKLLEICTADAGSGMRVRTMLRFYDGLNVVRTWNEVENAGSEPQGIEQISSFELFGIECPGNADSIRIHAAQTGWQSELRWRSYTPDELGFSRETRDQDSGKRIAFSNMGSWSACEYLPMGLLEDAGKNKTLFWQIETQGSWQWELTDVMHRLAIDISGPNEQEHQWWKKLRPGESFVTVPCCVGSVDGGFEIAVRELTQYRRRILLPVRQNESKPVIFNDYMNCLWASPTTEKEMPMIRAAASVGCEYYVIDAGWYTDGDWWYEVGEWTPSKARFPGGLGEVVEAIRGHGMKPGIWLEIEVMGVNCPKLKDTDDSWFFTRHGKRIIVRGRYQLDFSNEAVYSYAQSVVKQLVETYGIRYFKIDYNINAGAGTERDADSFGDGLLRHQRAYLKWLEWLAETYPDVMIENCSSGGMRMDYAMLSRTSIQSTSDQENYLHYMPIAVNAPTGVLPEQAAVWSYPLHDSTEEDIIFNMVNACLLRIHQSGNMDELTDSNRKLVSEGIAYHKAIREDLRTALPFWPKGIAATDDGWGCLGMECGRKLYVAVWRKNSQEDSIVLPIGVLKNAKASVRIGYPENRNGCSLAVDQENGCLKVMMGEPIMARILEITVE